MTASQDKILKDLTRGFINIISETNGITLSDTIDLLISSELKKQILLPIDRWKSSKI